jgi:hypothetical protein
MNLSTEGKKTSEVFFPLTPKGWQRLFVIGVTLDFFASNWL